MRMYHSNIKKSILSLVFVFLFIFPSFAQQSVQKTNTEGKEIQYSDKYFEISKNLDIFATLFKEINMYYVDEVNPNTLMQEGIDAMLKSLDPYTNYIPEDEIEDYRTMHTGQYGGIGALVGNRNNKTIVLMPYIGYPAHESGLKIGDEILKIDDVELKSKNSAEVSKLLKGQAGTVLNLVIKRFGESQEKEITVTRKNIKIDNVPYFGMIKEDVGYIQLTDFMLGAGNEVKNALEKLKAEGAKKIILDLRGNPGGLLNEAVNICNIFIPKDADVVSTKGKIEEWNKTYRASMSATDTEIPLIVLANGRSASASEIVSGVLQDYDRGVLIGQRTFGKGLVQTTRFLSYNSQLKVTTAKYYIPSGRCIQAIDYSTKDANGKAVKFPDSLKREFKTRNGRTVYDGNGLEPDLEITKAEEGLVVASLRDKSLIFDYATEYHYQHPQISDSKNFSITEAEYQAFVSWLQGKDYDYQSQVEKSIEELETKAKQENYYESIKAQLEEMKLKVAHNEKTDLQTYKSQIIDLLNIEIASRYYFQEGQIENSFRQDAEVKAALELFDNMEKYNNILKGGK